MTSANGGNAGASVSTNASGAGGTGGAGGVFTGGGSFRGGNGANGLNGNGATFGGGGGGGGLVHLVMEEIRPIELAEAEQELAVETEVMELQI